MIEQYELKDGKKRFKFHSYIGTDEVTGKQIYIKRQGFNTEREAEIAEARLKVEFADTGRIGNRTASKKFEEIYDLWFMQYKHTVKENTYVIQKKVADKHILPFFKGKFINKINLKHCQKVVNDWFKTYSKATNLVSVTSRIFDLSVNLEHSKSNPMKRVIRPKNTHKKPYNAPFYDEEQLKSFLNHVKDDEHTQDYVMFRILAYTGVRKAELLALQWNVVDEVNSTLTIDKVLVKGIENRYLYQEPKTESSKRVIDLDPSTMKLLRMWKNKQREELFKFGYKANKKNQLLFTTHENKHLAVEYPNRVLNRVIKKHNMPHITIHGFRHTNCSILFANGASIKEVQERLGHASSSTTLDIYNHVMPKERQKTALKFGQRLEL